MRRLKEMLDQLPGLPGLSLMDAYAKAEA